MKESDRPWCPGGRQRPLWIREDIVDARSERQLAPDDHRLLRGRPGGRCLVCARWWRLTLRHTVHVHRVPREGQPPVWS